MYPPRQGNPRAGPVKVVASQPADQPENWLQRLGKRQGATGLERPMLSSEQPTRGYTNRQRMGRTVSYQARHLEGWPIIDWN